MSSLFLPLLQAAPSSTGSFLTTFLPFGLVILIFYFLIIRPQNKKQKETERMLSALKKGDRVVTAGGIHGVIQSVKEKTVVVKVDESCKLEINRSAISTVDAMERSGKQAIEKPAKGSKKAAADKAESDAAETADEVADASEASAEEAEKESK